MAPARLKHGAAPGADRARRRVTLFGRLWANPPGRFLVRYPFITAIVFLVPVLVPGSERAMILATVTSLGVARLLLHSSVHVSEPYFGIGATSIQIVPDCTPMFPTLLLIGAILAFPASWRSKLAGVLAGIALMWVYNMVRIYALIAVLRYEPAWFDLVHVYLWQTVTLLVVLGCFVYWVRMSGAGRAAG